MLATMKVLPENMRAAAAKGFINATDCADYLVKKGMPFRDAYKITGTLVHTCIEKGCTLETLELSEYKKLCDKFDSDVFDAISLDTCVMQRKSAGGPAPETVKEQIKYVEKAIGVF
jgi:argininosuccinate lyase